MPYSDLRKGRVSIPGQLYFVTVVTENRKPIFQRLYTARLLINAMRDAHENERVGSLSWVVMPDHFHWLFELKEGAALSVVIKQVKAQSAHRINSLMGTNGTIWQKSFYDHALRKEENIKQVARYIVANPLRAGLADNIGDYPHWDAIWL